MKITLFNAVPKTLKRTRLIRVCAVYEDSWMLTFKRETEVDIRAESVRNIDQTELIELIIDLRKGVLEHVLLALKDS